MEVGEETVSMPKNKRLNQYNSMNFVKAATEDELVEKLASHESQIFIKAIYFSPTSNMHVAYILSNEPLNKENKDGS